MHRESSSHKGDNGKIAIIGGSRHMHGAPILATLAAEASGVDTASLCLPAVHEDTAKHWCLNVFVHPFLEDDLLSEDVANILELIATVDCAVMGPGIAKDETSEAALLDIIAATSCPMVLDATALQRETLDLVRDKQVVLTPHLGELERMDLTVEELPGIARDLGVTVFLKGEVDVIYTPDTQEELHGGNAGLTVGGTGDVLAGLIGGLLAQNLEPLDACKVAGTIVKRAGTQLYAQKGYSYSAYDVVEDAAHLLHTLTA